MGQTTVKVVAAALIESGDGLLLLHRARNFGELDMGSGLWEPPGGSVDPGETTEAAARREVREETGIQLSGDATLVAIVNYMLQGAGKSVHRFHVFYEFGPVDQLPVKLGEEHDASRLVRTPADLDSLEMIDALREFLLLHLASRQSS